MSCRFDRIWLANCRLLQDRSVSEALTDEALTSLAWVSRRLQPAHGLHNNLPGNETKSCRAREPSVQAKAFHRLLFGKREAEDMDGDVADAGVPAMRCCRPLAPRSKTKKASLRNSEPDDILMFDVVLAEHYGLLSETATASPLSKSPPDNCLCGSSSDRVQSLRDVCLVTSLRALGAPVPYVSSGPFRPLTHGNEWLQPLHKKLVPIEPANVRDGDYVLVLPSSEISHSVAAIVDSGRCRIVDGDVTKTWPLAEVLACSQNRWFSLRRLPEPSGQAQLEAGRSAALRRREAL